MRVKVLLDGIATEAGTHKADEEIELSEADARFFAGQGIVEIIDEPKIKTTKPTPNTEEAAPPPPAATKAKKKDDQLSDDIDPVT
jgi:hypothetical protein